MKTLLTLLCVAVATTFAAAEEIPFSVSALQSSWMPIYANNHPYLVTVWATNLSGSFTVYDDYCHAWTNACGTALMDMNTACGLYLHAGETMYLGDQNAITPGLPYSSLVGRIDPGGTTWVTGCGTTQQLAPGQSLGLACNDCYFCYSGNLGSVSGTLVVTPVGTVIPCSEDIPGFGYIGEFENHRYYLGNSPADWGTAESACSAAGGYMVCIGSAAENSFVTSHAPGEIRLGFTDEGHEGVWTWVNGQAVSFTNWLPGEPNNGVGWGGPENCGYAYSGWSGPNGPGAWNDGVCSISRLYVMECEGTLVDEIPFTLDGNAGCPWEQTPAYTAPCAVTVTVTQTDGAVNNSQGNNGCWRDPCGILLPYSNPPCGSDIGEWMPAWPGAPCPSCHGYSLIGRVNQGQPFQLGCRDVTVPLWAGEQLFLGINDDVCGENEGSYSGRLVVHPSGGGGGGGGGGIPDLGSVTLLSAGPPDWPYQLNWISGWLSRLTFFHICDGTVGSVNGEAAMYGWHAINYADSVVFTTSAPLTSGAIAGFRLFHPSCAARISWATGSSTGEVDGPLPVELFGISAAAVTDGIELQWNTASETNNDYFEIMRGTSETGAFNRIATLPSSGNSATGHHYEYLDRNVTAGQTYWYYLADVDLSGNRAEHRELMRSATMTGSAELPSDYSLSAYPNPFNPTTTISFALPEAGVVRIAVFDVAGRWIQTLVNEKRDSGKHTVTFDARDLPSGVYFARMESGPFTMTKKMAMIR